jgi:sulfur carrier protein ThiS
MKAKIRQLGKEDINLELRNGTTVSQLLKRLKLDSESVVVRLGKRIVTHDQKITDPEIEIISVISGG